MLSILLMRTVIIEMFKEAFSSMDVTPKFLNMAGTPVSDGGSESSSSNETYVESVPYWGSSVDLSPISNPADPCPCCKGARAEGMPADPCFCSGPKGEHPIHPPKAGMGVIVPEDTNRACCSCHNDSPKVGCYDCECSFCNHRCASLHSHYQDERMKVSSLSNEVSSKETEHNDSNSDSGKPESSFKEKQRETEV